MKFKPFNAEDIKEIPFFTPGEITFVIERVEEGKTKDDKNKTMVHLVMTDVNGKTKKQTLHLTADNPWRIKQLFESVGKPELCKKGEILEQDIRGLYGKGTAKADSFVAPEKDENGNEKQDQFGNVIMKTVNTWKIDKLHKQKDSDKPDVSFFDDKIPF